MTILIVGGACLVTVILLAVTWAMCPQGDHRASRPAHPGWGARARLRAARAGRSRPGTTELHHEPGLGAEDAATLTWLRSMRGLRHPGWTALALRARITVLRTITSSPAGGRQGRTATVASGDLQYAITHATTSGEPAPSPAGGHGPGAAGLEPGPESEPSGVTVPAPALLPIRGDAQDREGGCAPAEPRPAPGAALTGVLSPRHAPRAGVNQEGARAASAPTPGPTRLVPAADRLAAEVTATSPWVERIPFDRWESDTFVGGLPAIEAGT